MDGKPVTPVHARAAAIRDGKLNKNLTAEAYDNGMNLSAYLETLDNSNDHKNARSDAFNRVLRSCGIRTKSNFQLGLMASTLEDVVKHERAQHLAIEIFSRAYRGAVHNRNPVVSLEGLAGSYVNQYAYPGVRQYLLAPAIPLTEVVAITTGIDRNHYRPFFLQDITNVTSRVAELGEIPAVKIVTSEKDITLKKYGRRLDISYESIRHIPIDLLSFFVQRVAIKVEGEKVDKVVDVLVNGDGTSGTPATNYNLTALDTGTTATNLTLKAWFAFKMKFLNPRALTTILGQPDDVLKLMMLNMGSANIPLANGGLLFAAQAVQPINQGLRDGVRAGWLSSPPNGKLIGFDNRLSIERVFEIGGTIQETDKDVKSQINSLVLSEVEGYDTLDPAGIKTLNLNA